MQRGFVVNRYLFTGLYVTQGDEEDMVVKNLHKCVGLAGVIDVVSAVSALAAIKTPPIVDRTDTQLASVSPAFRFCVRDLLAGILGYLSPALKTFVGKASHPFDGRFPNLEAGSELHHLINVRRWYISVLSCSERIDGRPGYTQPWRPPHFQEKSPAYLSLKLLAIKSV